MNRTEEKEYQDLVLGRIIVRKGPGARRVSISVKPDRIVVRVPSWLPFRAGLEFLALKKEWALKALMRQKDKEALSGTAGMTEEEKAELVRRMRKEAAEILPGEVTRLAEKYGFRFNGLRLKHVRTRWGSCSSKGNINLNICLVRLPAELRTYVILHELCHLVYLNHGPAFHGLLDRLCLAETGKGRLELEKSMRRRAIV
jgi:predicted metal-dependent hydrolase